MNCEICGAPPIFKKGDRVKLNAAWVRHCNGEPSMGYLLGAKATVLGPSRSHRGVVRVQFDNYEAPTSFHQSFLTKVSR